MRDRIIAAFDGPGISPEPAVAGPDWLHLPPDGEDSTKTYTPAAVLVPLIDHSQGMTVLLTRRTDHLNSHAGQISFPGGRMEKADATPEITALRETEEEIGLGPDFIHVVGRLGVRETGTGYKVVPVIGLIDPPMDLVPDPTEVAEIFEVPLDFVLDPTNHRYETRVISGVERQFYVVPYKDYYIWGLTARLLVSLAGVIGR